jgi:predicted nucleotidyltransferase
MPLPVSRAPRRAVVPISALPAPEEEEDDVPAAAPVASARPSQTGSTGGIVPQGAGTWDRPPPARLSADPAQRQQQSIQRAQQDFEDKQRAENPFLFSNDVKQLSKVGGRRYDDAAVRAGEQAYRQQVRGDRQQAALDTDAHNSRLMAQFKGRGQQYYEDPLTKRLTPVLEDGTGRALYHETGWEPSKHPKSGLSVLEKRDRYGQRQFKLPRLSDSLDPEDEYLYADMGDGESTPYMTKEEAAKSADVSLARVGLAALKKQRGARASEALSAMKAEDAKLDFERLNAEEQVVALQEQIDDLALKAGNAGDTEVNRAAYQSRLDQLSAEQAKFQDMLKPNSEFGRRSRISKKTIALAAVTSARDAYLMQRDEIAANLRARGMSDAQIQADPTYQANQRHLTEHEDGVKKGTGAIQAEDAVRRRLAGQPVAQAATPTDQLAAGEPAALAARGEDRVGGVGIQEFARRYGSGAASAGNTLKLFRRSREIAETLENEDTQIDDKLRGSLMAEQQYVDQLYAQRLARLPADQQKRVQDTVALATEGTAKSLGKSALRGALPEGIYAAIEGGARLLGQTADNPFVAGSSLLQGVFGNKVPGAAMKQYADATKIVRDQIRQALPLDEEFSRSIKSQLAQGIGQAAGTLPTAVLGPAGLAATSVGQIYDEAYQDALASGATPEVAHSAAMKYLPAAGLDFLSDRLIVGKIMKPLVGKATVGSVLKDILTSAAAEGSTEGAQQAYLNQIASKLEGYDPNRPFDKEVYDSMLVGAVTGGTVTGVGQAGASAIGPADAPQAAVTPAPTGPADATDQSTVADFNEKLAAIPGGPQDDLRQRMQEGLSEQERAEMDRLLAESEAVEEGSSPTREDRQAQLEETFGTVRPEMVNPKTAEGSAEVFMEQAAEPLSVQTMRADAEAAERGRLSAVRTEEAPAEFSAVSDARSSLEGERAAAAQAGVSVEELRAARRLVDAAGGPRADSDIPTSNEPPPAPAPESAQPAPEVPPSVPQEAAPDVSAAEETPALTDREQYDALQAQMKAMGPEAYGTPAFNALWQQSEDIKNRNAGMPPGEVAGGGFAASKRDGRFELVGSRLRGDNRPDSDFDVVTTLTPEEARVLASNGPEEYPILPQEIKDRVLSKKGDVFIQDGNRLYKVEEHPVADGEFVVERVSDKEQNILAGGKKTENKKFVSREQTLADAQAQSPPPSPEQRLNDAGAGLPPISSMSRQAKRAELDAAGITTYKGKPLDQANPAEISAAVGKLRRGELTPEGEPAKERTSDRVIKALQNAKVNKPGQITSQTPLTLAYDAALDLAIVSIRAGRAIADVVRLAVARFRVKYPGATDADVARLTDAIQQAAAQTPEPTPTKATSKVQESLKDRGLPTEPTQYDVRAQDDRVAEAKSIIAKQGAAEAENLLTDRNIPADTRVAIGGELLRTKMNEMRTAKDAAAVAKDIRRIAEATRSNVSTESGQGVAMHSRIYEDLGVRSSMDYVRKVQKDRLKKMGGDRAEQAAQEAADAFNATKDQKARDAAIERLKKRYSEKPVTRMLNALKGTNRAMELNDLGVLTRDDMIDVAGKALGIPGVSGDQLKKISVLVDRVKNAKNLATAETAQLELAETLENFKGTNRIDLETAQMTLNVLASTNTQIANAGGNAFRLVSELASVAAVNPSIPRQRALWQGFKDGLPLGWAQARSIWETGRGTRDFQDKTIGTGSEVERADYRTLYPNIPGPVADLLNLKKNALARVGRFMRSIDAMAYYPAREAYARMLVTKLFEGELKGPALEKKVAETLKTTPEAITAAKKQAEEEGYVGVAVARRASEIIEAQRGLTPAGDEAAKQSEKFAAETTYTNEPEGNAGVIYRAASDVVRGVTWKGVPVLKPWMMFLRTPTNMFNATLNWTPAGFERAISGKIKDSSGNAREFTQDERNRMYFQATVGSALMAGTLVAVFKGLMDVTFKGPDDREQREQLMQSGWRPYSVRIGNGPYMSYRDTPALLPLAITGHVADTYKYGKADADETLAERVAWAYANALVKAPFATSPLTGLADLLGAATSGTHGIERGVAGLPANVGIPGVRLLSELDRYLDPKMYDSNALQRTVPFLRREGTERSDIQGRTIEAVPADRFFGAASNDPVDKFLREKNVFIPGVGTGVKVGNETMSDEQREQYKRLSGQRIRVRLLGAIPRLRAMTAEKAQEEIDRISRDERTKAKEALARMPSVKR